MSDIIPSLRNAAPAIIMAIGTLPMIAPDAPDSVRYGGSCLMAIAAILADLQSGKKLGYTDRMLKAVRKIPGLENADEGTLIGTLTLGACTFLGGGAVIHMQQNGVTWPELLKVGYNISAYPLSTAFDFQRSRLLMERYFGKEFSFIYQGTGGSSCTTSPIPTSRLLQHLMLVSGAAGVTAYGTMIDAPTVQFTGVMFAAANGLSIARLLKYPISEVTQAKIEALHKRLMETRHTGTTDAHTVQREWQDAQRSFTADSPAASADAPPAAIDTNTLAKRTFEAIAPTIAKVYTPPDKNTGIDR